jgi:hypothetical protein
MVATTLWACCKKEVAMKKTEKELQEELLSSAALAIHSYEEYLLDKVGWRELAQVMDALRKSITAIDKHKLSK